MEKVSDYNEIFYSLYTSPHFFQQLFISVLSSYKFFNNPCILQILFFLCLINFFHCSSSLPIPIISHSTYMHQYKYIHIMYACARVENLDPIPLFFLCLINFFVTSSFFLFPSLTLLLCQVNPGKYHGSNAVTAFLTQDRFQFKPKIKACYTFSENTIPQGQLGC